MHIRTETPVDKSDIFHVVQAAFAGHAFSQGTEGQIVNALRGSQALTLSLVAEHEGKILGHVAFSPVLIALRSIGWFGLGPVAVLPQVQGQGIGSALILEGLRRLKSSGANGCVVLGSTVFYARFGFRVWPGLVYPGPGAEHFMGLGFCGTVPDGVVTFHAAFGSEA